MLTIILTFVISCTPLKNENINITQTLISKLHSSMGDGQRTDMAPASIHHPFPTENLSSNRPTEYTAKLSMIKVQVRRKVMKANTDGQEM